ncbi:MAG TPA: hypothetical protein VLV32_00525 [Burkholderiales bacterium]|nr:hypothetical protein [Burkholderiales bacterium]
MSASTLDSPLKEPRAGEHVLHILKRILDPRAVKRLIDWGQTVRLPSGQMLGFTVIGNPVTPRAYRNIESRAKDVRRILVCSDSASYSSRAFDYAGPELIESKACAESQPV